MCSGGKLLPGSEGRRMNRRGKIHWKLSAIFSKYRSSKSGQEAVVRKHSDISDHPFRCLSRDGVDRVRPETGHWSSQLETRVNDSGETPWGFFGRIRKSLAGISASVFGLFFAAPAVPPIRRICSPYLRKSVTRTPPLVGGSSVPPTRQSEIFLPS